MPAIKSSNKQLKAFKKELDDIAHRLILLSSDTTMLMFPDSDIYTDVLLAKKMTLDAVFHLNDIWKDLQ